MSGINSSQKLNDDEKKLLCKYLDGESGLFCRLQAKALLNRSEGARSYIQRQERLRINLREILEKPQVSLWDKISDGIERKEREELLEENESWFGTFWPGKQGVFWGMSGAITTACISFVLMSGLNSETEVERLQGASPVAALQGPMVNVSHQTARLAEAEGIHFASSQNSPVEVDWLHSSGRVRMIPGAGRSAPIMWISSRKGSSNAPRPDLPIRMLPDRAPRAFIASSTR